LITVVQLSLSWLAGAAGRATIGAVLELIGVVGGVIQLIGVVIGAAGAEAARVGVERFSEDKVERMLGRWAQAL
jgi:hypothetical protein